MLKKHTFQEAKMLICGKCNAEYKEGEKFCSHCGSLLIAEEAIPPIHEEGNGMTRGESSDESAEAPAKRFICPKCRIIYERGDACIRCGSPVVEQARSAKEEELPSPSIDKIEKEKPKK